MFWLGVILGLFAGTTVGLVIIGACAASKLRSFEEILLALRLMVINFSPDYYPSIYSKSEQLEKVYKFACHVLAKEEG